MPRGASSARRTASLSSSACSCCDTASAYTGPSIGFLARTNCRRASSSEKRYSIQEKRSERPSSASRARPRSVRERRERSCTRPELVGEDALEVVEAEGDDDEVGRERRGPSRGGPRSPGRGCSPGTPKSRTSTRVPPRAEHRLELARERVLLVDPVAERDRVAEDGHALHARRLVERRLGAAQSERVDPVVDLRAREASGAQLEAQPRVVAAPHGLAVDLDGADADAHEPEGRLEDEERDEDACGGESDRSGEPRPADRRLSWQRGSPAAASRAGSRAPDGSW